MLFEYKARHKRLTSGPSPKSFQIVGSKNLSICRAVKPRSLAREEGAPRLMSSNTVSASGSGTREALWESYQALSYLQSNSMNRNGAASAPKNSLVRRWEPESEASSSNGKLCRYLAAPTHLVCLLYRGKFLSCFFCVPVVLVWVVYQRQSTEWALMKVKSVLEVSRRSQSTYPDFILCCGFFNFKQLIIILWCISIACTVMGSFWFSGAHSCKIKKNCLYAIDFGNFHFRYSGVSPVFPAMADLFNSSSNDLHKPGIVLGKAWHVNVDFIISRCDFP